jgi:hypothetical protein
MNTRQIDIDLSSYGSVVFTGRTNGRRARAHFGLDEIDNESDCVVVRVPDDASVLNSSFLLGFLGKSIQQYGSKEEFLRHFRFSAPKKFQKQIDTTIDRALFRFTGLEKAAM